LDSWNEESFPVPIAHFDFDSLDKPADFIKEAIHKNQDIEPILESLINRIAAIRSASKIAILLGLILEASKPRMVAHQLVWGTGMTALDGAGSTELGKKYGVSKQAFEQGALRICEKLSLRMTRNMRSEEAKDTMRKRNYRKVKYHD